MQGDHPKCLAHNPWKTLPGLTEGGGGDICSPGADGAYSKSGKCYKQTGFKRALHFLLIFFDGLHIWLPEIIWICSLFLVQH